MSAVTVPPLAPSLRGRLSAVIGALRFDDRLTGRCPAGECEDCRQFLADTETLELGKSAAVAAVHKAPTESAAMAAYLDFFAALGGMTVGVETMAVPCGTGAGQ